MTLFRYVILLALCFFHLTFFGQARRALIIGNDTYSGNSLENARNDASAVHQALSSAGYDSTLVLDADHVTMLKQVDAFVDRIRAGDTALFYYAGHGMQLEGENYLVPTDFQISSEKSAKEQGYSLSSLLERLTSHGATTQVVILDACRDNPFAGSRSMRGGWAGVGTSAGAFLAFGTSPGSTASDAPGDGHGLFTKSLLKFLTNSDLDIEDMFRKVREGVIRDSGGKQVPWVSSSLIGSFHIKPELDEHAPMLLGFDAPTSPHEAALSRSVPRGNLSQRGLLQVNEQDELVTAVSLARGMHFQDAINVLKTVLSVDPRCALALRLLGLLFHATARDVEALGALNQAVSVSAGDPRAAAYLCAVQTVSGSDPSAHDCSASIADEPSADGYLALAGAQFAKGEEDSAYMNATRSISMGGSDLSYALRGAIASQQGRRGLAERDYSRAAQLSMGTNNR